MKKKILFYCDQPDWAYDMIRKLVSKDLENTADFYYDYCCCHVYHIEDEPVLLKIRKDIHRTISNFKAIFKKDEMFDLSYSLFFNYKVTPFWQSIFTYKLKRYKRKVLPSWKKYDVILYFDFYFDFYANLRSDAPKLIKGIYTDSFPPQCLELDYKTLLKKGKIDFQINIDDFCDKYFANIDVLAAGSPKVLEDFKGLKIDKFFLNYYKEEIFVLKTIDFSKKELMIGWTGNPNREFKNFYTIIIPVVEELQKEGFNYKLKTRFEGPMETLPAFYNDVDLIVITSVGDSGPFLFSDACLSGIPSVSTRIGFPNIVIEDEINGFFIEPTKESLKSKLIHLYNNRNKLESASKIIRQDYLKKMGNQVLLENWKKAFDLK